MCRTFQQLVYCGDFSHSPIGYRKVGTQGVDVNCQCGIDTVEYLDPVRNIRFAPFCLMCVDSAPDFFQQQQPAVQESGPEDLALTPDNQPQQADVSVDPVLIEDEMDMMLYHLDGRQDIEDRTLSAPLPDSSLTDDLQLFLGSSEELAAAVQTDAEPQIVGEQVQAGEQAQADEQLRDDAQFQADWDNNGKIYFW